MTNCSTHCPRGRHWSGHSHKPAHTHTHTHTHSTVTIRAYVTNYVKDTMGGYTQIQCTHARTQYQGSIDRAGHLLQCLLPEHQSQLSGDLLLEVDCHTWSRACSLQERLELPHPTSGTPGSPGCRQYPWREIHSRRGREGGGGEEREKCRPHNAMYTHPEDASCQSEGQLPFELYPSNVHFILTAWTSSRQLSQVCRREEERGSQDHTIIIDVTADAHFANVQCTIYIYMYIHTMYHCSEHPHSL